MMSQSSRLTVKRAPEAVAIGNNLWRCELSAETGGLPRLIAHADGPDVLRARRPFLSLRRDGTLLRPALPRWRPDITRQDDAVRVLLPDIAWQDEHGQLIPDFRLALDYEFHDDGAVFVRTFFYAETLTPGRLQDFVLAPQITVPSARHANWAYWRLAGQLGADAIQNLDSWQRCLPARGDHRFAHTIIPYVSFDYGQAGRRDRHFEMFVEQWNSLLPDHRRTETNITWRSKRATLAWNFLTSPYRRQGRTCRWGNTWGWCLRQAPKKRKIPARIVHFFDNSQRYPAPETIKNAAEMAANVVILHENWKLDVTNQQTPYDADRLRKTVRRCHDAGLRVALYVRATDDALRETGAATVMRWLRKDSDGLYMDYGSPALMAAATENAPGGRIAFQRYHRFMKQLRAEVGEKGLLFSHAGPFVSAVGTTAVDANVVGEQEQGKLTENRTVHAYYSGLSLCPSSLWTAVFPAYRDRRMLALAAATAQSPFVHLGVQIPDSALAHDAPLGVANFAADLWRFWRLFDRGQDVTCHTPATDSQTTGATVFADVSGALLVVAANISTRRRRISVAPDFRQTVGKRPACCWSLSVADGTPTVRPMGARGRLTALVEPYGIVGWLLTDRRSGWGRRLREFEAVYEADCGAYWEEVATVRSRRFEPPGWGRWYLKVEIVNWPHNYEDSLWEDLFDNEIELVRLTADGAEVLGYVGRDGLRRRPVGGRRRLRPGAGSPWIDLNRWRRGCCGRVHLALRTRRKGRPFYSFVRGQLSPAPRQAGASYLITYHNGVDRDWDQLDFSICYPEK